jgi:hypothetical protein
MVGARLAERAILYPLSAVAERHGATAVSETESAHEAYRLRPHWRNADGPPEGF